MAYVKQVTIFFDKMNFFSDGDSLLVQLVYNITVDGRKFQYECFGKFGVFVEKNE